MGYTTSNKIWRDNNREKWRAIKREWYYNNLDKAREMGRNSRMRTRKQALEHYGNQCVNCGENRYECLTFDHIYDDGAEHRRKVGKGSSIVQWLKKNNWPKDIVQILCWNCNAIKQFHRELF